MSRVAVVGATGYAGAELVRILAGHPHITLTSVTSRQFAGQPFADATLDHQWIHVDPERAKAGPFGAPIAHGQLTQSIMMFLPGGEGVGLPALEGMKMGINYGWNKVRFPAPVPVGALIRTRGEHYWRVAAANGCGAGPWSPVRSYTVRQISEAPERVKEIYETVLPHYQALHAHRLRR